LRKFGKYCGDVFLGYRDEVRVSFVWEERAELVVGLVRFVWIRACVKTGPLDGPDHQDQQNAS